MTKFLAEQGVIVAQFHLGTMYEKGNGVCKDDAEALKWYRKAAEQGNTDAQLRLGTRYENGNGVCKDDAEALKWRGSNYPSVNMSLLSQRLVILDTETTGLEPWSRVVELGAVILDVDGNELGEWGSLVLPDILDERADAALAINHISRDMLLGQPDAKSVAASFCRWMKSQEVVWVTAYNVAFDRMMCELMGLVGLQWASCIMKRAQAAAGSNRRLSLAAAAEHFGVKVVGKVHRAVTDARTAAGIACAIRRREIEW